MSRYSQEGAPKGRGASKVVKAVKKSEAEVRAQAAQWAKKGKQ